VARALRAAEGRRIRLIALTGYGQPEDRQRALDRARTLVGPAVAHLAGAMDRQLWLLVPHVQDWRWLRGRTDSPWYPTARLFRQPQIGDWDGAIATMAKALAGFAETCVTLAK
jgi:CheY-like chemotaxis protein